MQIYEPALEDVIDAAFGRIHQNLQKAGPLIAQQVSAWQEAMCGGAKQQAVYKHPLSYPMALIPWWAEKAICRAVDVDFQTDLVYSTFNGYYAIRMIDNLMDGHATMELQTLPALHFFYTEFQRPYQRHFPAERAFWRFFEATWFNSAEVTLEDARVEAIDREHFVRVTARKTEAVKIPMAAVCYRYERPDLIAPWAAFVDLFGCWHQMYNDLFDWRKDSALQTQTYFLSEAERCRGPDESVTEWVIREGVDWGIETLDTWMAQLRELGGALGSSDLLDYLQVRETMMRERQRELAPGLESAVQLFDVLKQARAKGAAPEIDSGKLGHAIAQGVDFLYRNQLPYGEFKTYASSDEQMAVDCHFSSSPFVTALVAYGIGFVEHARVQEMIQKALDFLLAEMEGPGLWRYWSSRNPQHQDLQPDLDDICCVSYVLRRHGRTFPSNEAILLASRDPEGLFYTYVAPRTGAPAELLEDLGRFVSAESLVSLAAAGMLHEVDCAVNANVLFYLGEGEHTQAAADQLVDLVLRGEEVGCSKYYRDPLAFYYMLSRAYFAGCASLARAREHVVTRIENRRATIGFETPLAAALAACTLLNFEQHIPALRQAIAWLSATQREDGAWPRSLFYMGGLVPYYGSEELTTAFCLEALARYRQRA